MSETVVEEVMADWARWGSDQNGMLCADTVDAEVSMEVSVDQEFSPDLNDNTSKAYRDFNNNFQNQVRGEGKGTCPLLDLGLGPGVALGPAGSDMSPGILGVSDTEDLPECPRVPGCEDSVPEVGDPFGDIEAV
jgi:hypothetical protein